MDSNLPKLTWSFTKVSSVSQTMKDMLVTGEEALFSYKNDTENILITNKRFIIREKIGIREKKTEIHTIPFKNIIMYATENGGTLHFNSELRLWTNIFEINLIFNKDLDVRQVIRILAANVV